jgi:tetratricopeptide (TPR) repeat protein
MRYLCVHCEHRFEAEGPNPPTRCPRCMRATGVKLAETAASGDSAKRPRASYVALGLAALALTLGGVVGFLLLRGESRTPEQDLTYLAPLEQAALVRALASQQVDAGALATLLEADASIEAFAEQAAGKAVDAQAKARALTQALRARARAQAFVPWSLGEPRSTPVLTAREALTLAQKDGARAELYPLELAVLEVSALRSLDVPAMVAELIEVPGERAPLEGAGYLGYFVVAVPRSSAAARAEPGSAAAQLYDPFAGRELKGTEKHKLLPDAAVVGAALSLRAIHEVAYCGDPKSALASSSHALKLASSLPAVRTARGVIVLGSKMVEQGLQEFAAANQLRSDAPRLHNLASAKLMTGDLEGAGADLSRALEKAPDYAGARATLGAVAMLRGDADGARAAFERAEQLAPDLSLVQWGLAEYLLRSGEREDALERAERAHRHRPSFDAKVRYGVLLHQAGRYDEMRKLAHELVNLAPEYRKQEVRELVIELLGPTALDPVEPDPSADDLADLGGPALDLKLGSDSKLLGSAPTPPAAPPTVGNGGEPVLMLGDPKKLKLGDESTRLKLKLGEP